ncbi:hypothetical protein ACJMK2_016720 [Sinanodonta woodiana]|uniref:G-protein coupled receptors family 1 profile domain-containing protein n=1 Tax=Sinanodonta woodiana TaxID=1069815 RepID=A0ABD3UUL0_SINWO
MVHFDNITLHLNATIDAHIYYTYLRHMPEGFANIFFGYLKPVLTLFVFGINVVMIRVLSTKRMRSSANAILIAIAISNTLTMAFPAIPDTYYYTFGHFKEYIPPALCRSTYYFSYPIPAICHTVSIWLSVALAFLRYVSVRFPLISMRLFTMKRTIKAIVIICIFSALVHCLNLVAFGFTTVTLQSLMNKNKTVDACEVSFQSVLGINFQTSNGILIWPGIVIAAFLPCLLLLFLDSAMLLRLRRQECIRHQLQNRHCIFYISPVRSDGTRKRTSEMRRSIKLTIVIITLIWLVEIPCSIVQVIGISINIDILPIQIDGQLIAIFDLVTDLSYSQIFLIYCFMSSRFRSALREAFRC